MLDRIELNVLGFIYKLKNNMLLSTYLSENLLYVPKQRSEFDRF